MTKTNSEIFRKIADDMGMPRRTLEQVKKGLARAKKTNSDEAMARLMMRHGRLTDDAILWIGDNYASVWE